MSEMRSISLLLTVSVISLAGCATRSTITIDSQADLIMILKPVKVDGAVYRNGHWEAAGKVTVPAGWVAGPEGK